MEHLKHSTWRARLFKTVPAFESSMASDEVSISQQETELGQMREV